MQHIEQVTINGTTYHIFNQSDLLCLIRDHLGDKVASLVSAELEEVHEDKEAALFDADVAYKDLEGRTDFLQATLEDVQALQRQASALLEVKRLDRPKLARVLIDMRETIHNAL